jgi:hypothetical protein
MFENIKTNIQTKFCAAVVLFYRKFIPVVWFGMFVFYKPGFAETSFTPTGPWYLTGLGQVLLDSYSGSELRDDLFGAGLFVKADYLEQGGLSVGYNYQRVDFKADNPDIIENTLFLSGRYNYYPGLLPGRVGLRLDGYLAQDKNRFTTQGQNNSNTITDDIFTFNPQVSFLNLTKTFYLDLGYAQSEYRSSDNAVEDLEVNQWTPTLGLGLNQGYDWIQVRAYFISLSESNRVIGKEDTTAMELKWTRWFGSNALLGLENVQIGLLGGERLFAIDSDAAALYSVPDMQTGAYSLGGQWRINERTKMLLMGGFETYKSLSIDDSYYSTYFYLNLSRQW